MDTTGGITAGGNVIAANVGATGDIAAAGNVQGKTVEVVDGTVAKLAYLQCDDGDNVAGVAGKGRIWYDNVSGKLYGSENAGPATELLGGGGTFVGQVLFEYDGSAPAGGQFDAAAAFEPGGTVSSLTFVADATKPLGGVLRFGVNIPGNAFSQKACVWLVTAPLPAGSYRVRHELEIANVVLDGVYNEAYFGIAMFAEVDGGGDLFAYLLTQSDGATWGNRIDQGAIAGAGGGAGTTQFGSFMLSPGNPGLIRFDQYGAKPAGDKVKFSFYADCHRSNANIPGRRGTQVDYEQAGVPPTPVAPNTWNALSCLRFGLCFMVPAGGAAFVS